MPRYNAITFDVNALPTPPRSPKPNPQREHRIQRAEQLRAEGFSYPEIAKALNISVGTAWHWVNK